MSDFAVNDGLEIVRTLSLPSRYAFCGLRVNTATGISGEFDCEAAEDDDEEEYSVGAGFGGGATVLSVVEEAAAGVDDAYKEFGGFRGVEDAAAKSSTERGTSKGGLELVYEDMVRSCECDADCTSVRVRISGG